MLSPRESATRERMSLDGLWRFALDAGGVGRAERWWAGPLPGSAEMPVPASFNDVVPTHETRYHVGDVWYQRMVRVPRGWDGQRIVVRFDAATHRATVWVGDVLVGEHEGGYTPFEFDVSDHARPGEAARVTVVVNNELSWESIPPGYVEQLDDGRRVQQYFHDFFNSQGYTARRGYTQHRGRTSATSRSPQRRSTTQRVWSPTVRSSMATKGTSCE